MKHATAADSALAEPVMLVIGSLARWRARGRELPQLDGFHYIDFVELTAMRVADIQPDVILSALVSDDFDAVEVATVLQEIGFDGRYRVIAQGLPNPQVVRSEVSRAAPDVDFNILSVP